MTSLSWLLVCLLFIAIPTSFIKFIYIQDIKKDYLEFKDNIGITVKNKGTCNYTEIAMYLSCTNQHWLASAKTHQSNVNAYTNK